MKVSVMINHKQAVFSMMMMMAFNEQENCPTFFCDVCVLLSCIHKMYSLEKSTQNTMHSYIESWLKNDAVISTLANKLTILR